MQDNTVQQSSFNSASISPSELSNKTNKQLRFIRDFENKINLLSEKDCKPLNNEHKPKKLAQKISDLIQRNSLDTEHAYKALKIYIKCGINYNPRFQLNEYIIKNSLFSDYKKASEDLVKALKDNQHDLAYELLGLGIDISLEEKDQIRQNLKPMIKNALYSQNYDFVLKCFSFDSRSVLETLDKNSDKFDGLFVLYNVFLLNCTSQDKNALDIARALLDAGVYINTETGKSTPLHRACTRHSSEMIDFLLENNADVHAVNKSGETALHIAASYGNTYAIGKLCQFGAKIDQKEHREGYTPLHIALNLNEDVNDTVKACLENGASIEEKDGNGLNALEFALTRQNAKNVLAILSKVKELPKTNENGLSIVHRAAGVQSIELMQELTKRGLSIHAKDDYGRTVLHHLCLTPFASIEFLTWLRQNGFDIEEMDDQGNTALHTACQNGTKEFVQELISSTLLTTPNKTGLTPFHIACESGNVEAIKAIAQYDEKLFQTLLSTQTKLKSIPLHHACVLGNPDLIKLLLPSDKDLLAEHLNARAQNGKTPLHIALEKHNSLECVVLLLEKYMEFNIQVPQDKTETLLDDLLIDNRYDIAAYLIQSGFDLNKVSQDKMTSLAESLKCGDLKAAQFLMDSGAKLDTPLKNGVYPFHHAHSSKDTVEFVLKEGCDLLQKDDEGYSLLDRVIVHANIDTLKYILEHHKDAINSNDADLIRYLLPAVTAFYNQPPYLNVSRSFSKIFDDMDIINEMLSKFPNLFTAKDERGQTLFHHACKFGSFDIIKHLISRGWSLFEKDNSGKTPLMVCIELNRDCSRVITELGIQNNLEVSDEFSNVFKECLPKNKSENALLQPLLFLLNARVPTFYDEYGHNDELLQFVIAVKNSNIPDHAMPHIIGYALKMNNTIPLTRKTIETIERIYLQIQDKENLVTNFFLALQTHENLSEIERAITLDVKNEKCREQFDNPSNFYSLPIEEQIELLNYAQVFRMRKAVPIALHILKQNSAHELLTCTCLKVLSKAGIPTDRVDLLKIIHGDRFSMACKIEALKTLCKINPDPMDAKAKKILFDLLQNSSENEEFTLGILECLQSYTFSKEDKEIIDGTIAFKDGIKTPSLLRACAFLLSQMPDIEALKAALSIVVVPPIWGEIERFVHGEDRAEHYGDYDMFTYRPKFHDSAYTMKRIIAERLVNLHRVELQHEINAEYEEYKKSPTSPQFKHLQDLQNYIKSIRHQDRCLTSPLYFPEEKVLLRGINSRKGEVLGEEALRDLLTKGAGSADLSLFSDRVSGTWGKTGQTFASTSVQYVTNGYFDTDGSLIFFDTNYLNERMLRRDMRLQKEVGIHTVNYSTIPHAAIRHIFVPKIYEPVLSNLIKDKRQIEKEDASLVSSIWDKIPKKSMKLMHASLTRRLPDAKSPHEKITFFEKPNPLITLKKLVKTTMHEKGLKTPKTEEIIEENIKRQIARSLLCDIIEDKQLQRCLKAAMVF